MTFTVNRIELKHILTLLGVSERSIDDLLGELNKQHRHVNAVTFAGILSKLGLRIESITNTLRRIGIDDVTITNILNTLDTERIKNTYGKLVELELE